MNFEIRKGMDGIDFKLVHSWLTTSYWSPGVSRERVEQAARGSSLVLGAFSNDSLVGYCRIVSDRTTFAWICDVWVDELARGQGIAKAMVRAAISDPEHQALRRWVLATKDAHELYKGCGFVPLPEPERWMVKLDLAKVK